MKVLENHIASIRAQLNKQLPQSQRDLVGQLLYTHTHHEIDSSTQNQERVIEALTNLIDYVIRNSIADARMLRGLLLSGAGEHAEISSACSKELSVLNEYLLDLATTRIAECSVPGWYLATVIGNYFLQKKEPGYLQELMAGWRDTEQRNIVSDQLLSYTERTSLGFEGISGLLILMINLEKQAHEPALEKVIREGVRFILSFRSEVDFSNQQYAIFPQTISSEKRPVKEPRSLAWGGSDFAESLLLYRAYDLFGDKQLQQTANLIGLNTLLRKEKAHLLTQSATIYGGTAGVALTYLSLYRLSGHKPYWEGYRHWIGETISMLGMNEAGEHHQKYPAPTHDLYNGLLGAYLVILSHQLEDGLQWPGVLLL